MREARKAEKLSKKAGVKPEKMGSIKDWRVKVVTGEVEIWQPLTGLHCLVVLQHQLAAALAVSSLSRRSRELQQVSSCTNSTSTDIFGVDPPYQWCLQECSRYGDMFDNCCIIPAISYTYR